MKPRVVVLGGGVAGMSAAHELIERGFETVVLERQEIPGGKARSIRVVEPFERPTLGGQAFRGARYRAKNAWVPGEHGFRFFPGFYRHVIDTMARIPQGEGKVADHLVDTSEVLHARFGKRGVMIPVRFPRTPRDLKNAVELLLDWYGGELDVTPEETAFFAGKIWQIMTSCEERRLAEYERHYWWDFIEAERQSPAYQKLFGNAITRSLVAAKAERASTRTIGNIFIQLFINILDPTTGSADRVLDGPTNEVWIEPWLEFLVARGVDYRFETKVVAITCRDGRIESVGVESGGKRTEVRGDYFVAALPIERMAELVTPELVRADPALGKLGELSENVEWMNGIQFYLKRDVPLAHGHAIFVDTPWALTSVSQAQFWRKVDLSQYGDGTIRGILSVDISDWDVPGFCGKAAERCTRDEIASETWEQLKRSLNVDGVELLRDQDLHSWFLDPDIVDLDPTRPGIELNREPLLVNYYDTWSQRPEAVTAIPNLFLASDYVRTHTDLATMEAANEAARRAVNGLIAASQSGDAPCRVWPLSEPVVLAPLRAYDRVRFEQGLPWDARVPLAAEGARQLLALISTLPAGSLEHAELKQRLERDLAALAASVPNIAPSADETSSAGAGAAELPPEYSPAQVAGIRIVPG
jgi:uncharacterized protein with NAD-binding domain and iron-sulfur cluster